MTTLRHLQPSQARFFVGISRKSMNGGTYVSYALLTRPVLTDQCVDRALGRKWNMPVELAVDLVALALYDIVIYADDSTSMKYAENGSRIDDMKVVLERVTEVATLFDEDGTRQLACQYHTTRFIHRVLYAPALPNMLTWQNVCQTHCSQFYTVKHLTLHPLIRLMNEWY